MQVVKEPIGQKGARITSHVSLPGRYVVFMPTVEHVGVSRKIVDDDERRRLKSMLKEIRQERRRRRLHRAHGGAGPQPRGLRARRALPAAHLGRGARGLRAASGPRCCCTASRAWSSACCATCSRDDVASIRLDQEKEYQRTLDLVGQLAARAGRAGAAASGGPEHPRGPRRRQRAGARPALQGLAGVGRLHRHQPDRGAGRDRRQHRPLHGQEGPRGDDPQDQPGGRDRDRAPDPAARPGRHHRRGLHRHGGAQEPPEGDGRPGAGAAARPLPVEAAFGERVRPGDPHAQARQALAGAPAVPALPLLRGQPA